MTRSAHVDSFARDHLPPRQQWPKLIFGLPELLYPEQLNCAHELLDATAARLGGDRRCLVTDSVTWTYADLLRHTNRIANVLVRDLGLVPGNRVLMRGTNNPWQVACWLAVLKAGGVVVSTMPLLRAGELRPVIEAAQPSLAICDVGLADELVAAGTGGAAIVPVGGGGADDMTVRAASRPDSFAAVPTAADDVALIAFTSGTTGRPKGCMHFHRDVLAIADTFSSHVLRPHCDSLFVASPPMAFTYGLGGMLVFPLRVGAASLLPEKTAPPLLAEAIARHRATAVFTAPTAYRAMLRLPGVALDSLEHCVSAGEHLPAATWEAWREATGQRIIDGIGATEMLHIFISASADEVRPGSTGRAVPGFRARVVDDDGQPVADGDVGRLQVQGPVGCRYLSDERQLEYVRDGWNVTGDSYVRDEDGYYWYQARTDDMIISSGYNIAGPEVEGALLRHPDVAEAAVVGVPDEDRGTVVKAFVVLAADTEASAVSARLLQDFVKHQIAPYKYPRVIEFVEALPRTSSGKVQRFRLREQVR
ncbi:MAG: AMP-binding protein [Candidatus Dormibacteraeota bacterium]|uniref:AMP-binding protein n=1 Tax=Candidatus Aeolococcus gillhamiae TaxID=3127015 RepID=A0A934NA77_9BACT|nr:AMP-binding protein [Candidatus Dormibacteraeota bacterium]